MSNRLVVHMAGMDVEPVRQVAIPQQRFAPPHVCQFSYKWQRYVGQCKCRRSRHRARHIRYAVVHNVIHNISRICVCGRAACLEASALINRDIDQNRPCFHLPDLFRRNQFRRGCTCDQHCANDEICLQNQRFDGMFC